MTVVTPSTTGWWSELTHVGQTLHAGLAPKLVLADPPYKAWTPLSEALPDFRAWLELSPSKRDRDHGPQLRWLDAVIEGFLGHSPQDFLKAQAVGDTWKAKAPGGVREIKPDRVLRLDPPGEDNALPIFISTAALNQKDGKKNALDLDRFLRSKQIPMGLITDGQSLRWVVAGNHQNAFTQWDLLAGWGTAEARLAWQGLYTLLGHGQGWKQTPEAERPHQLGQWLLESSKMQGDLSNTLGEQIRESVETLVHALDVWTKDIPDRLQVLVEAEPDPMSQNHAIYTAAVRLVMRMVVIAFAESRDLLPTTFRVYRESYGLEALWQRLKQAKAEVGFDLQRGAWMQLLALFRLVHDGSAHPDIALRAYGGDLFKPGDPAGSDPVSRAMALWEAEDGVPVSDKAVLTVLTLLKQTNVKVNGKSFSTPVDFSTLSTEYIGLLYEGLLDYDLRTAPEPMLLLNLGQQPLLPLSLLTAKSEKDLKELLETLAKEKATKSGSEDGEEEDGEEEAEGEEPAEDTPEDNGPEDAGDDVVGDEPIEATSQELVAQAWAWAKEAAQIMPNRFGLGNLKRGQSKAQKPAEMDAQDWDGRLLKAAKSLVVRVISPGERFLIRWSGTRKGSGTFYTRPALTEPLIRETLRPLCFDADGNPRTPEVILGLRVVDPAMGSASFLVGALRYLTEALYDSLVHHRFQRVEGDHVILTLPFGLPAVGSPGEELPPVHHDDPDAEPKLKQRLKRHIVERCLYGVDLNSLAVELAKLAVWVETLDRNLPFGFLDHKLRCGNALVGCWLDRVDDYPILAWDREGGDSKTGVETKALKDAFKAAKVALEARLFQGAAWTITQDHQPPQEVLPMAREALAGIHDLPVHLVDEHRQLWQKLTQEPALQALQTALDRWCALFFWPGVDDQGQPLKPEALPMPDTWRDAAFAPTIQRLASHHRFFHWELAFPEVFTGPTSGFDAVLGNPPWDVSKPNSNEFFTVYDPIFRTYKKNKANERKAKLFLDRKGLETTWNRYVSRFKAMRTWVDYSGDPFAASLGRGNAKAELVERWRVERNRRVPFSDPNHPCLLQGSADLNTFKLFLEQARVVLAKGGRLGFVIPSGIYTDAGSTEFRRTFLDKDHWELLYGFENRKKVFQIDSRFKFLITVITKGLPQPEVPLQAAFMRLGIEELCKPKDFTLPVTADQVRRFSPKSLSFMELRSPKETTLANTLYSSHPLLGDLGFKFNREFHMVDDATLWKDGTRKKLETIGLLRNVEDTRDTRVRFRLWQDGWVSLLEGKHIWQHNPYYLGTDTENGLNKFLNLQRFIRRDALAIVAREKWETERYFAERNGEDFNLTPINFMPWVKERMSFRNISSSTNRRTFVASMTYPAPHGEKAPDISINLSTGSLSALLNSYIADWIIRRKVTITLNKFYIETLPVPPMDERLKKSISQRAGDLTGVASPPVTDPLQRLRLRLEIDALVAHAYALTKEEFADILLDTECGAVSFWKTDSDLPGAYRQPQLTLEAYRQLLHKGLDRFIQDGAEIPEAALAHRRPLLEIWAPEDGWEAAWAEARAMATSQHEWDLFLGKEDAVQLEYGTGQPALAQTSDTVREAGSYQAEPQPGALFDTEEFRQDGKRWLL